MSVIRGDARRHLVGDTLDVAGRGDGIVDRRELVLVELGIADEDDDRGDRIGVVELAQQILHRGRVGRGGQVTGLVVGRDLADLAEQRAAECCGGKPREDQDRRREYACPRSTADAHTGHGGRISARRDRPL